MKKWAAHDAGADLKKASKSIKTIQFKCNNTVVKEQDKIIDLETLEIGNWMRSDSKTVDIIENCTQVCRVNVKDRKAPLRLHIQYIDLEGTRKHPNQ